MQGIQALHAVCQGQTWTHMADASLAAQSLTKACEGPVSHLREERSSCFSFLDTVSFSPVKMKVQSPFTWLD